MLVNNAGYGVIEPFLDATYEAWTRTLALNVTALAMACKAAGRVMRDQRSGRIVNITSPGSRMALPNYTAYAASKAGVDSITRAAAVALAPYGVLVNSLAPGMMDTEMQRSTEADLARVDGRDDLAGLPRRAHAPHSARPPRRDRRGRRRGRLARARRARLHDRRTAEHRPAGSTRTDRRCCATLRPATPTSPRSQRRATNLRRHMLTMARGQGQGYIGQGLGIADLLAALYFHELRYDPEDLDWAGPRPLPALDRPLFDRALGGARRSRHHPGRTSSPPTAPTTAGSRCRRSTRRPGVEMIGGSLGHGLGQAVGRRSACGCDGSAARVFVELSDGEMQEGSTWEAAMSASHFRLDDLVALIDCNGIQADGAGRARHGAGRRQMARLRLGDAARSTATTWPRSSAR